jgi:hypothetical protein
VSAIASFLLVELRQRGVEVVADGDRLRYRPTSLVPPELHERIVRLKPDLLVLLRTRAPASEHRCDGRTVPCRCCGSTDFWALARVGNWVCGRCHAPDHAHDELIWLSVPKAAPVAAGRPNAVCMSCGGVRFVRLKNGRRSVCAICERPEPDDVAGDDEGYLSGPPEANGGGA